MEAFTAEQQEMLKNTPATKPAKDNRTRNKVIAVTAGVLVGGAAAYYFGPRIIGKFKATKLLKMTKVG